MRVKADSFETANTAFALNWYTTVRVIGQLSY